MKLPLITEQRRTDFIKKRKNMLHVRHAVISGTAAPVLCKTVFTAQPTGAVHGSDYSPCPD